jgi:hypothetical protein
MKLHVFGIEAYFDLSILTAVDKVNDVYCIARCEKIIEQTSNKYNFYTNLF